MKLARILGVLGCALFLAVAPDAAAQKIGFINSQELIQKAPGAAQAQQTFQRELTQYESGIKTLEQQLNQARADLQRQQGAAARQQQEQAFQQKLTQYQDSVQKVQQTIQQRQQQLVQPIMTRISQTIEQIRKEGQYAMIFDVSAGALISADPALDLTQQVLQRLGQSR